MDTSVDHATIAATYERIRPHVRRTPIISIDAADFGLESRPLVFKLELLQHTGSFKPRGALASLLSLPIPSVGVVAASGGNHGLAVAFAARKVGVRATIFVPGVAAATKRERIREMGAELVIAGDRYADALAASRDFAATSGALEIHAYDQPTTLLGQGSVALEIEQQCSGGPGMPSAPDSTRAVGSSGAPDKSGGLDSASALDRPPGLDTILVAVGGGGLIGGMAAWFEGRIRLVAVEPRAAPTLYRALEAGKPVDAEAGGIAADSLAPRQVGALMFPLAQKYVEKCVLVEDDAIRAAQRALWRVMRVAAEPGGSAAFAALLSGAYNPAPGERVGIVLCGANTDAVSF
jgi:threonine dehydratase